MQFSAAKPLSDTDRGWRLVLGHIGADPNANITAEALREPFPDTPDLPQTDAIAFASERRWSAFAFGHPQDAHPTAGAWVLGAPESLIDARSLDPGTKTELRQRARNLAASGKRTMLLAHSTTPSEAEIGRASWR